MQRLDPCWRVACMHGRNHMQCRAQPPPPLALRQQWGTGAWCDMLSARELHSLCCSSSGRVLTLPPPGTAAACVTPVAAYLDGCHSWITTHDVSDVHDQVGGQPAKPAGQNAPSHPTAHAFSGAHVHARHNTPCHALIRLVKHNQGRSPVMSLRSACTGSGLLVSTPSVCKKATGMTHP